MRAISIANYFTQFSPQSDITTSLLSSPLLAARVYTLCSFSLSFSLAWLGACMSIMPEAGFSWVPERVTPFSARSPVSSSASHVLSSAR
jgi:hypothetical protein